MSVSRSGLVIGSIAALVALGGIAVARYRSDGARNAETFPDKDFQFGEAVQGRTIEHTFTVKNASDQALVVRRISPFGSVSLVRADTMIEARGTGHIRLRFNTASRLGSIIELANVYTASDSVHPAATLRMRGMVVQPLQFSPQDRVYFFTVVGEREQRDVELINHFAHPLHVTSVTSDNPIFAVAQQTLEEGKRYRIRVTLDPKTAPGKYEGQVTVRTDDSAHASLPLVVTAFLDDRVSTTPKQVDFSTIMLASTSEPVVGDKQVIVRKFRATDFRVLKATTDLPFLDVHTAPHKEGESVLVTVKINQKRAHRGLIRGTLTIETNDPAFPMLKLPIVGNVV